MWFKKSMFAVSTLFIVSTQTAESPFDNFPMTMKAAYISFYMIDQCANAIDDDIVKVSIPILAIGLTNIFSALEISHEMLQCSLITYVIDRYICMFEKKKREKGTIKRMSTKEFVNLIFKQASEQRYCL